MTPLDTMVEKVALAIERADNDHNIPEGSIEHPEVSSWGEHLARKALEASCHAELVEVLKALTARGAQYADYIGLWLGPLAS
jgi:hypothetical protein